MSAGNGKGRLDELTLADIDTDGALEEMTQVLPPTTRLDLMKGAVVGGTALLAGLAGATASEAAVAQTQRDISILRFDLVLEYLQAGLYTEAERLGALKPTTLAWSRVVGAHERAHARAIRNLLGSNAVKSPSFDYRGVTQDEDAFIKTAVSFEELTAALLKWQAVRLDSREILAAAVSLHSVETRHAAWIRHVLGLRPVIHAFDKPAPQREMAQLIRSTHFIVSRPKTTRKRRPSFTG
jgi:Ferritin-like domain